ncbi:MAG: hypothetical protein J1F05_02600 [Muribaculaceae bacterium]|nr:hypothetical protein [Muribaculaceae bacterium]
MKELKIKGEAVCRPVDRRDGGAVVENVVNMRPKGGDGGLVTVGRPMQYRRLAGCRPLCRFRRQDDSLLLASTGTTLVTAVERVEDAPTGIYPSSLPGEALCAVQRSAGNAIVMTSGGAVSAGLNTAGLAIIPLDMEIPAISLMARTSTPVAASVAPRTLSKDYGGAVRLTKRDADDVAADLSSAYLDMCADAATVGAFIQPALCRYRLRDRSGNIVYISPVVLLSHPTGAQCASPVAITSADRRNIDGYVVEADTWQLEVSIPEWRVSRADEIAALEIYMSPQFHPYNPDMRAYTSLGRGAGSSSPFIYAALPGRNCGLGDDAGGSAQKTIMRAMARIDDLEEPALVEGRVLRNNRGVDVLKYANKRQFFAKKSYFCKILKYN